MMFFHTFPLFKPSRSKPILSIFHLNIASYAIAFNTPIVVPLDNRENSKVKSEVEIQSLILQEEFGNASLLCHSLFLT